jgi:hypothetical protein
VKGERRRRGNIIKERERERKREREREESALRCDVEESSGSALRPAAFSAWLARCL